MDRAQVLNLLESLTEYIDGDRVTTDDDIAIASCLFLRHYLVDHMTEDVFPLNSNTRSN